MLVDIESVADAVRFAQCIARKMSKDPEVDSLAGEAAWRALYTFDEERGVKLSWWIAQLTKQSVYYYWRKRKKLLAREKMMDELWWKEQSEFGRIAETRGRKHLYEEDNLSYRAKQDGEELQYDLQREDWQLLTESFVLKWPLDVIARERGISLGAARKLRAAAVSRLEAAC